jgi:hypothetical protein
MLDKLTSFGIQVACVVALLALFCLLPIAHFLDLLFDLDTDNSPL